MNFNREKKCALPIVAAVFGLLSAGMTSAPSAHAAQSPAVLTSWFSPVGGGIEHVIAWSSAGASSDTMGNHPNTSPNEYIHTTSGWYLAPQPNLLAGGVDVGTSVGDRFPCFGAPLFGYYNPGDGNNHLFMIDSSKHIIEWFWTESTSITSSYENNSAAQINYRDVTYESGAPLPATGGAPVSTDGHQLGYGFNCQYPSYASVSTLTGIVDSSNEMHLYYASANRGVTEVYFVNGRWWQGFPSGNANATGGTGMTSLWDGSLEHIYYTGTDGTLWEDYLPGCSGWCNHALTGSASTSPSGFLSATYPGVQAVWGAQPSGGMRLMARYPSGWVGSTLSSSQTPALSTSSPSISIQGNPFYIGSDQNIYQPDQNTTPIQQTSGGPQSELTAVSASTGWTGPLGPLTGGKDATGNWHLFYIGTDGHVHEYYGNGSATWSTNDLTHTCTLYTGNACSLANFTYP